MGLDCILFICMYMTVYAINLEGFKQHSHSHFIQKFPRQKHIVYLFSIFVVIGVQQGCGGFLNNTAGGTVTSVDIDNNGQYENDLNCAWTIMMPDNKLATFNITRMDIETDSACSYDALKVILQAENFGTTKSLFF